MKPTISPEPTMADDRRQLATITRYWAERGIDAKAELVIAVEGRGSSEHHSIYGIRSRLNGHERPGVRV